MTSFFKKYVHQIILSFFFFRSNQVVAATTSNNKLSKTHGYSFSFLQFQERISLTLPITLSFLANPLIHPTIGSLATYKYTQSQCNTLPTKTNICQIEWSRLVFRTKKGTPLVYATPPKARSHTPSIGNASIKSGRQTKQLHPIPIYMANENLGLCFHFHNVASVTIPQLPHVYINHNSLVYSCFCNAILSKGLYDPPINM